LVEHSNTDTDILSIRNITRHNLIYPASHLKIPFTSPVENGLFQILFKTDNSEPQLEQCV